MFMFVLFLVVFFCMLLVCFRRNMPAFVYKLCFYPAVWISQLVPTVNSHTITQLDKFVFFGPTPTPPIMQQMFDLNIKAVVNLQDEYRGPVTIYANRKIQQLHIPVVDFRTPSYQQIQLAVNFILRNVCLQRKVYVHCLRGHGRSAAIAFCYLATTQPALLPIDIQKYMTTLRRVKPTLYTQPEIQQFVSNFKITDNKIQFNSKTP